MDDIARAQYRSQQDIQSDAIIQQLLKAKVDLLTKAPVKYVVVGTDVETIYPIEVINSIKLIEQQVRDRMQEIIDYHVNQIPI